MSDNAVKNNFTMDPNLLVSVIKSQAGTLSKALLEGVMNSIDAGASQVHVTIRTDGFTIADNGRGFSSEEEVRNWFGRFGTPHQAGDAIYGRFRMGRGQMMSFAATRWQSNDFCMSVDIEKEGLTYELSRLSECVKGCRIEGMLYQPLADHALRDILTEMRQYVAYTPKPVYVNGELYGANPDRLKSWSYEDELAYYKVTQDAEDLQVYNQGVFVEQMSNWRVGMGGIVVSKRPLEVNFARNSVMEHKCPVWKEISVRLQRVVLLKLSTAKKLNDGERKYLARRIHTASGALADAIRSAKVLTDPTGRHMALSALQGYRKFVHIPETGALACAAHGHDGTFVVTDALLTRFGISTLDEFMRQMLNYGGLIRHDYEILEQTAVAEMGFAGAKAVNVDTLTRRSAAAFKTLEWLNQQVAQRLAAEGYASKDRQLLLGRHKKNSFVAWTDGSSYITANKGHLKLFETGLDGVLQWAQTLVHEYMHDTDDSESHSHGEVFYAKFHDAVFSGTSLAMASLAQQGLVEYLKNLAAAGVARPQALTRQLKPALRA